MGIIKLYINFFLMHLKSQMQYRKSFIAFIIGRFMLAAGVLIGIIVMFQRYDSVKGFVFEQILLCSGIVIMAYSVAACFGRGFNMFASMIANGEFDRIMVRPRNEIFLVLSGRMDLSDFGAFLQASLILAYAVTAGSVNWTGDKILTLFMMIISGVIIFSCLFIIYAGLCFFTLEGLEFMNILTEGGKNFGQYPYVIYGDYILKFLTFVVPLALFQYYPLLYILERETSRLYMFAPVLGALFILPSYAFWRFGVRKYKSTGS